MRISLRTLITLVVAVAAGFLIFRACRGYDYKNYPPTATGDWVAFGDSITAGYAAAEGSDFPTILGLSLGIKIINKGVPGQTTGNALGRLEEIAGMAPRVVLLCLGGNDTLRKVPVDEVFDNLGLIIDRLHAAGSFVVLIGIRSASAFDHYDSRFEKLAREKKVLYVENILMDILGTPSLMADYIHPNEAGQKAIADRLEEVLRPHLPKL